MNQLFQFTKFCNLDVFIGSRKDFVDLFVKDLQKKSLAKSVFSVNGQALSDYYTNTDFKRRYECADYIHADGMSIVIGTRLFGVESCKERIATTDWFHDIVGDCKCKNVRHFLLGGDQSIIERTVSELKSLYPHIIIAGYHHGYFEANEERLIVRKINSSNADILWVGLGRPKQEIFATNWKNSLNVVWIKTCGGLFDFLSGKNRRAPKLLQNLGLEWLFRLINDPRRMTYRYLKTNSIAILIMLREGYRNLLKI